MRMMRGRRGMIVSLVLLVFVLAAYLWIAYGRKEPPLEAVLPSGEVPLDESGVHYSEHLLLRPVLVTAGSEQPGREAAKAADNSGMSGFFGPLETHGADPRTMWLTEEDPGGNGWLQLDMGAIVPLGRMLVWNYNEPGAAERGVAQAQILYSADGETWSSLGGENRVHTLELAAGAPEQRASARFDFGGAPARYVKIVPAEDGAKGRRYGLSEIRLYRQAGEVRAPGDLIPAAAVRAGSETPDAPALHAANHYGMSGAGGAEARHGNAPGTMWRTEAGADAAAGWIEFDLGGTYPLGEMRVWNYNAAGDTAPGIRWAKVKHSLDGETWTYLNGGEPFEFASASGAADERPTGLAGGGTVEFGGAAARYVRIEPNEANDAKRPGNWGGDAYGLSEVRFFSAAGLVAEAAPEWSSLFARTEGWTGSDGIYSIPVNGMDTHGMRGRTDTLFLFSDTFAGSVHPSTRGRSGSMPYNNTMMMLDDSEPDPAKAGFLMGTGGTGRDRRSIVTPETPYSFIGTTAANVVRESAGMTPAEPPESPDALPAPQPADVHDNDPYGHTMWLSAEGEGEHWIRFDLGSAYALGEMQVWNYNQFDPEAPDIPYVNRGIKNANIYYSADGEHYEELKTTGYPFQFAKADGSERLSATNLTGGGVVDFEGAVARYVKIVPNSAPGDGNWGGATGGEAVFGLSQVRFHTESGELLRFVQAEADSEYAVAPAGQWYWLQDGLATEEDFYLFPVRMEKDPEQPPGFQFRTVGVSMVKIPNAGGPDLSGAVQTDTPLFFSADVPYGSGQPLSITFGAGVMPNTEASGAGEPDGFIYVYGYRDFASQRLPVVARAPEDRFEAFNEWRFWGGQEIGWSRHIEDSVPLLAGVNVSPELSVSRMQGGPLDGKYVLVFEKDTLSGTMAYSVADSPVGPFSEPVMFYHAPEPKENPKVFTYNAKAHPHLSEPGELLVTYNVNSSDMQEHYADGTIYRPRWLRLRWIGE